MLNHQRNWVSCATWKYRQRHAIASGRLDEAGLAFEKMLTYANHLGP
jgi:hypothetical protein